MSNEPLSNQYRDENEHTSGGAPAPGENPIPDSSHGGAEREQPAAFEEITPATAAGGAPLTLSNLTGQQVGRYRIEQQIGSGGVAMVYQAYDQVQGIPVALKVLMPHADANTYSRFRREALTAGGLRHPHIVRILQVGTLGPGGLAYIAMELVDGESLGDLLNSRPLLHPQESCNLLEPIARALHHAHEAGIVHRDVKPSNILLRTVSPGASNSVQLETLDHPVVPLLSDFGVARYLDAPELTNTGRTVGTPAYMAPEQCAGRRDIDGRADIYALGCVLYRCVTGRLPFSGAVTQILHAHVYEPLSIDNDTLLRLPPALVEILRRSLAKQPDARYATAGEMAEALAFAAGRTRPRQQPNQVDATQTLTMNTATTTQPRTPPTATTVLVPGAPGMTATQTARQAANPLTTRTVRPVQPVPAAQVGVAPAREERVYRLTWAVLPIALALLVFAVTVALMGSPFGLGRGAGDGTANTPVAGFLPTPTAAEVAVIPTPDHAAPDEDAASAPPTEAPSPEATATQQPVEALVPTPTDTPTDAPPTPPPATWTPEPTDTPTPTPSPSLTPTVTDTPTPTETWTPEPTVTLTPLPTDTPTPEPAGCAHAPDSVWVSFVTGLAPPVQQGFICAYSLPAAVNVELLMMEHGYMLRMDDRPTAIYLYFSGDSRWDLVYGSGDSVTPDVPIPGPELFVPTGVFGQVWEDQRLAGALGFALAAEPDRFPGRVQTFPGGTLIYNFTNGRVFAFFADGQS